MTHCPQPRRERKQRSVLLNKGLTEEEEEKHGSGSVYEKRECETSSKKVSVQIFEKNWHLKASSQN